MKLVFLASSGAIVYYMRFHKVIKMTYDREQDTFRYQFLVLPCAVLAMMINNQRTPLEVSALSRCSGLEPQPPQGPTQPQHAPRAGLCGLPLDH